MEKTNSNFFNKIKSWFRKEVPIPISTENYGGKTREDWWTTKFTEKPIIYNAQDSMPRDVRNFIFPKSYVLDNAVRKCSLKTGDDSSTVLKCCLFVQDYIKYVGDMDSRKQNEFWQYPEDTLSRRTGDCEDGAILMKSLTLCAGVPDWKVKIVAGNVKGGGHAYCTFIRDDDTQAIMDWCYWSNRLHPNARPKMEDEQNYYEIWFSFNHNHSYAETKVEYSKGNVKK